ncbi:MAG: ABC transporter substrate-binding protein [Bacteroidota bacterium]
MKKLTLALDWTPNINHIGFFVAKEKGFYSELDLAVDIIDPSIDHYQTTPAKKVELGVADFALCPTESIISFRTKAQPFDLIGIAALLQEDLSAIVVRQDSQIKSPKDLDGKIYSSYKARYEDGIVREMIKNDGGKGALNIIYPNKLGIWNTLLKGEADATWIFVNWEGVAAEDAGHVLRYFKMQDYQIPYSYSPLLATSEQKVKENQATYRHFVQATKKGHLYSQQFSQEAINILRPHIPETDREINLANAFARTAPSFGHAGNWGQLDHQVVQDFLDWIKAKGLEINNLSISEIVTNDCLND